MINTIYLLFLNAELPLKMKGHCLDADSNDQIIGQEKMDGCFPKPNDCLKACQKNISATGCEYNKLNQTCYVHTAQVTSVRKTEGEICWLFVGKY